MIDEDLDAGLRAVLADALAEHAVTVDDDPVAAVRRRVDDRRRRHRRRSTLGAVAAAAMVVLVVAASVVVLTRRDGGDDQRLDTTDVAATTPPTEPEPSTDVGPTPPTEAIVTDPSGVQVMPEPPVPVRGDAAVVWTGSEIVIWGGDVEAANMGLPGPSRTFVDGAAYSPATGTWRVLPASPLTGADGTLGAALDDGSVVFVSGVQTARYDPADDTWQRLEDAPSPVYDLVSVGDAVVSPRSGLRLDAAAGQWRPIAPPPAEFTRSTFTWTGSEIIGVGGSGTPFTSAVAFAYDPGLDSWRRLPDPPGDLHSEALDATWDGTRVVVANYDNRSVTLDPVTGRWADLPTMPVRSGEWGPTIAAAGPSGRSTVVLDGAAMLVLTEDDRWIPIPHPRPAGRAVVGGATIYLWGTDIDRGVNVLTAIDPDRVATSARRFQVGVGSVEPAGSYEVADASYAEQSIVSTVEVRLESPSVPDGPAAGGPVACTVASQYLGSPPVVEQAMEEVTVNDGEPKTWIRNPDSTVWQTTGTTSDTFTVTCDWPGAAEALARSASFRW